MNKRQLVDRYFDIFFQSHDFAGLHEIFEADLRFAGPFFQCNSAQEYVDALTGAPHGEMNYTLRHYAESDSGASTFYTFERGEVVAEMAQLFEFSSAGRIASIRLIFDPRAFDN